MILEPRGADRFDDPELVVTGKSANDQDDLAIATVLGLMWAALFKFDPVVMARFSRPGDQQSNEASQSILERQSRHWMEIENENRESA